MSPADILTAMRILLVPAFVAAEVHGYYCTSLATAVAAAITDVADGRMARARGSSKIGPALDIGADFAFVITAFALLAWGRFVPAYLPSVASLAFAAYCLCCLRRQAVVRGRFGGHVGAASIVLIIGVLATRLGFPVAFMVFARWGSALLVAYFAGATVESLVHVVAPSRPNADIGRS